MFWPGDGGVALFMVLPGGRSAANGSSVQETRGNKGGGMRGAIAVGPVERLLHYATICYVKAIVH